MGDNILNTALMLSFKKVKHLKNYNDKKKINTIKNCCYNIFQNNVCCLIKLSLCIKIINSQQIMTEVLLT